MLKRIGAALAILVAALCLTAPAQANQRHPGWQIVTDTPVCNSQVCTQVRLVTPRHGQGVTFVQSRYHPVESRTAISPKEGQPWSRWRTFIR